MPLATRHTAHSPGSPQHSAQPFIGSRVQPKLAIGEPGDQYEVEADRTADSVVAKLKGGEQTTQPFLAPRPVVQPRRQDTVQKEAAGEKETGEEQIQEKPISESITPLVQMRLPGGLGGDTPEDTVKPVQAKCADCEEKEKAAEGESPVQMKCDKCAAEEEKKAVQTKCAECEAKEKEAKEKGEGPVQAKCDKCEEKEAVQAKKSGGESSGKNLETQLNDSKGGGSAMAPETQSQMSEGFGTDFSNVRIHNDANAVQMNRELGSHAFTNGNDIYFNEGKYDPGSESGQHLLAHELTHTVQQGASTNKVQKSGEETIQKAEDPCAPKEEAGSEAQADAAETAPTDPACSVKNPPAEQPAEGQEEPDEEEKPKEMEAQEGGPVGERQSNAPPPDEGAPEAEEPGTVEEGIQQEADAMMGPCEIRKQKTGAAAGGAAKGAGGAGAAAAALTPQQPKGGDAKGKGGGKEGGGKEAGGKEEKGKKGKKKGGKEAKEGDFIGAAAARGVSPLIHPEGLGEAASPELQTERDLTRSASEEAMAAAAVTQAELANLSSGAVEFKRKDGASQQEMDDRAQTTAAASAFVSAGAAKANGMLANGLALASGIRGSVEEHKAQLMADIAIKRQVTSAFFAQSRANAEAKAAAVKGSLAAQHAMTLLQIEMTAMMANLQLTQTHQLKSTELKLAYEAQLAALPGAYQKGYSDIMSAGERKGNDAVSYARKKAAGYRRGEGGTAEEQRLVINEEADGFWDGYLTYNRYMARADAAEEVGGQYKEGMVEQAQSKADFMMCGQAKDAEFLGAIFQQGNDALQCALLNSQDAINQQKQAAIMQAAVTQQEMMSNIDNALKATLAQLEEKEAIQLQLLSDYGVRQIMSIERDGEKAIASALAGVNEAVRSLLGFLQQYKQAVVSAEAPDKATFFAGQVQLQADFDSAVADTDKAISETVTAGGMALGESFLQVTIALQSLHDQGISGGTEIATAYTTSMDALLAAGINAYTVLLTNVSQGIAAEQQTGIMTLDGIAVGSTGLLTQIGSSVADRFKETVKQLEEGMQNTIDNELDAKICAQAEQAAADVEPWWKSALKILLVIIVVVIVIAVAPALIAAIGPAIAGLAGSVGIGAAAAGWITTAVVGAVLGGVSSVVIQVGNNLIDIAGTDKELSFDNIMKGAWGAFVTGFIGGAFGGIGGKFAQVLVGKLGPAMSKVWGKVIETGVDMVFDVVGSVLGDLAAGKEITWEGLIQGVAMSFVIGKVTNKMTPTIQKMIPIPIPKMKVDVDVNAPKTEIDAPKTGIDAPKTGGPEVKTPKTGTDVEAPTTKTPTDAPKTDGPDIKTPKTDTDVKGPKTDEPEVDAPKKNKGGETDTETKTKESDPETKSKEEKFQNDEDVVNKGKTADGHELKVDEQGNVAKCSTCKLYEVANKKILDADPDLAAELKGIREEMKLDPDSPVAMKKLEAFDQKIVEIEKVEAEWPPSAPTTKKPKVGEDGAALWRYKRYRYNKFKKGATPDTVQDFATYKTKSYDAVAKGNRPGRVGGKDQVAAKNKLAEEGIMIVEDVRLGKNYPDGVDPKPNSKGGIDYYEVGKLNKNGQPESRELKKILAQRGVMGPNDRIIFVDKMNTTNRVVYDAPTPKTSSVIDTPNTKTGGSGGTEVKTGTDTPTTKLEGTEVNGTKTKTDQPEVETKTKEDKFQNDEGVVNKGKTADGHELKVDEEGNIAKCSDCKLYEVSHKDILDANPELRQELQALRERAKLDPDDPELMRDLEAFDRKISDIENVSSSETNVPREQSGTPVERQFTVVNPTAPATNLVRRVTTEIGDVVINTGHGFNRPHASGGFEGTGLTANQIESHIVHDLENFVNSGGIVPAGGSGYTQRIVVVSGTPVGYRTTVAGNSYRVTTYFPNP